MLEGNQWAANLDSVVDSVINEEDKEQPMKELNKFFSKHLPKNFIPFTEEKEYESKTQSQVAQWITDKYRKFLNYFENNEIPNNKLEIFNILSELYELDSEKWPTAALSNLFYQLKGEINNNPILADEQFQIAIYQNALKHVENDKKWCMDVLTRKIPEPHTSPIFADLFFAVIKTKLSKEETQFLLRHFSHILERIDEKLDLYNYLENKLKDPDPTTASLAIPYIVDVTINRSVDYGDFYSVVYKAITPEALSIPGRASFFDTIIKTVTSHDLPKQTHIAFAVKLSRMLPLVSPDVQLDILNVLHCLIKNQQSVAALLKPLKTPVANVDGSIEECTEQTLWEVLALYHSSTPIVAEFARTLGQMVVFPDLESFDLKESIESVKAKPTKGRSSSNWIGNLDKSLWN